MWFSQVNGRRDIGYGITLWKTAADLVLKGPVRKPYTPDRDFGANTAGAMAGGLAENASMLLGFRYLLVVAVLFYFLSAIFRVSSPRAPELNP